MRPCLALGLTFACALVLPVMAAEATSPAEAAPLPAAATADDDDFKLPFRLSLPTLADHKAWQTLGFRLQLGYGYGAALGLSGAPDADLHVIIIRVGARLDEDWSLLSSFQYGVASGGILGMRFSGTLDPTWHVWSGLELALGAGFAGIVEGGPPRTDPSAAQRSEIVASYTFPDNSKLLPRCSGVGAAALARVGWNFVIGPLASTTLSAQVDGQWTGCEEDLDRLEPDTAEAIVRRQWWGHVGSTLTWTIAWR